MNIEKFENAGLVVEKERVLVYSKLVCPLDCKYCFSENLSRSKQKESVYLSAEQLELLSDLPEEIKTIMLGCDTEFFQNKREAISVIEKISDFGKDVSIITKLNIDDSTIDRLRIVNEKMDKIGNILVFSTSIPCFDSSRKWEPKAPKVEKRIETLVKISNAGIDSMVAIRPLIPNIDKSELDKVVELTSHYVFGYYSGPLYIKNFENDLFSEEELIKLGCVIENVEPHWMPKGNTFIKIENPNLMKYLTEKIKSHGNEFFDGAANGMEFLRKNKNA